MKFVKRYFNLHTFKYSNLEQSIMLVLTAPVIYSMIIPAIILDLFIYIYQNICFPVYGIEKVDRSHYIAFDRHKLSYLNSIQKINCTYCSYFNGLIAYVREVASRTEKYWCPIKHSIRKKGLHKRHKEFFEYGDESFVNDKRNNVGG
ncbi:hypothetical protein M899_1024 [Bacteriovorax sp. BSW11_IV]|nr:hypothetical protein M899_1024 [Bacteriovorax sp. BSW11_IV]